MKPIDRIASAALLCFGLFAAADLARAQTPLEQLVPEKCNKFHIDHKASQPLEQVPMPPTHCAPRVGSKGFLIPDPICTPGAINPTVTAEVLRDPDFTTKCIRNEATSEEEKHKTYGFYHLKPPAHNVGATQTCELDHLISLELGGADTLDNIWPQCGPSGVVLHERYFKQKDLVEDHLGQLVKEGKMDLAEAQRRIAGDWTELIDVAKTTCSKRACKEIDPPKGQ